MKPRGQFSKMTPMSQSHHSLNKFKNKNIDQRVQELTEEIFKVKIKGQQPKILTRSKQSKEDQLKKHIKTLQNQLKKKIAQNPILCRLLKTKNSNELSHIDLYLQFNNLKSQLQQKEQTINHYKNQCEKLRIEKEQLSEQFQEKEKQHIQEIQTCIDKVSKKEEEFKIKLRQKEHFIQAQTIQRQEKLEQANVLIIQLKKKNVKLNQQIKNLKQFIQSQKTQNETQLKKIIENNQKQNEELFFQIQQKSKYIQSTQDMLKQKNSQIQELNRFIDIQKQKYEAEESSIQEKYQEKIKKIIKQHQKQILETKQFYQSQSQKLKEDYRQMEDRLTNKLGVQANKFMKQKDSMNFQIEQQKNKISSLQLNIQTYLTILQEKNQEIKELKQVKEELIKQISLKQERLLQHTNQLKFLSYQKDELSAKINKQTNVRGQSYQKLEQLQRKIFNISQQNQKLTNMLSMKQKQQSQFLNVNKFNEQICGERYKAIGRITQINHKIEYLISQSITNKTKISQGNFIVNDKQSNYYHNSKSKQKATELTQCIEQMTANLDNFINAYLALQRENQILQKDSNQNNRQIQSILSNFVEFITNSQLQEMMSQYIYLRKLNNSEEQAVQRRRSLVNHIVEILIQLKTIKHYSSQNTSSTQKFNSVSSVDNQSKNQCQKSNNFLLKQKYHSKNLHVTQEDQDQYQQDQYNQNFESDSLEDSIASKLLPKERTKRENIQNSKRKRSIRQSSIKFRQRFCTEPADIQQKSTYEISKEGAEKQNDQNINESNRFIRFSDKNNKLKVRRQSKQKGKLYIANHQQIEKDHKSYKKNIRERLSGKRQNILNLNAGNNGINRELIQKKYFR